MKSPCGFAARLLGIGCLVFRCVTASAVVFTNDTSIAPTDLSYEGQDVVLSNCTVVVDGAHSFSNLLVAAGGTLTHTANLFFTSTNLQDFGSLPVVLTGTDVVALPYQDIVAASIGVTNTDLTLGYTNEVDYLIIDLGNGQTGLQRTPDSAIPDGATVLASFTAAVSVAMPSGLNLAVSGDVQVLAGGEINVTGKGHDGSTGSGHGASLGSPACGSGAGHGGLGGSGSSNAVGGTCYGVFYQPGTYGSGGGLGVGGPGGAGGGSVRLVVGGHAEIDGRILANGQDASNSRSGGGAGGSIWISAQTLNGTGVITANGGAGEPSLGGGGGGGRIAISFASNSFSGPITAYGGVGWVKGGAGSVFTKTGSQNGLLSLNNGDQAGANTLVTVSDDSVDVLIHSNVVVQPSGTWTAHNVTVQSGAALSADACGLPAGIGSGAGTSYPVDVVNRPCGGGGYGGCGGYGGTLATNAPGGNGYGIVNNDAHLPGSGGGRYGSISIGGAGGGVIGLNLYGTLLLEGRLSANGGSGAGIAGGGGSGGAIFIVATNLTGAGSIAANGGRGAGSLGGGGGGGRIHLVLGTNAFSGPVTAFGGAGAGIGGAGTIFLDSSTGRTPLLIVDNAGQAGTNTPIGAFTFVADVFIRSNAVVAATGPWSVRDLTIASNSAFSATASGPTTIFITASQITLDPTAAVIADGAGYRAAAGPGAGGNYGGGSHGGLGGSGNTNVNAFGGGAYDSATGPNLGGSGGGNAGNSAFTGGAGGGALRFTVSGDFVLEGLVSANGRDSAVGGGGAGGSVYLTAKRLLGSGVITADGGSCAGPVGGGGGGGRIAIAAGLDLFAGTVTAYGGDGFVRGGAGTIYWPFPLGSPSAKFNQLILDNGGRPGTNTPVTSLDTADLIVRHAAKGVVTSGSASFHKLLIGSNSSLTLSGSATALNVSSGLVEFGGTLKTEGLVGNGGIGAGGSAYFPSGIYYGGGGGHGGYGGAGGVANARGGNSYDLTFAPTAPGGVGGGSGSTYAPFGGLGGGVLHLFVSGGFTNNGQISADGKMGVGACAGGGAGGSLWLELGGLSGSGLISANGGPGILPGGGGGGGGRISVSCDSNSFSGPITAVGGSGVYYGGAGTVYLRTNKLPYAQLIVDNGGNAGTNTTFVAEASSDLTVSGGGMAVLPTGGSSLHRIQIKTNGVLLATSGGSGVTLNLSGGMTIDLGGSFALDGLGYASGTGPGAGWGNSVGVRGGGGHGGYGAGNPQPGYSGNAYDSIQNPASGGSGGGDGHPSGGGAPSGGAGGGVLRLQMTASGAVLTVNGRLTANGRNGGVDGGGGAGGSLCLNLETLTGSGIISANGGAGSVTAGGGGGGRIAIQYQSNNFTGTLAASGGGGVVAGGAGTIYLKSPKTWVGRLLVDNGGMPGTNTPVSDSLSIPTAPFEFAIAGDAVVVPLTPLPALSNLTLNTGGRLTARASDPNLPLAVLGDVTIGSGSAITVDGKGLGQGAGWGRGASFSSQGAGGGYGGVGGDSLSGALGGTNYGLALQPTDRGSGGGIGGYGYMGGSEGGGVIRLSVGGKLIVDGSLSAKGNLGLQDNSGGGSGGSIWVTARTLTGAGSILATGGDGELLGGGGGGGGRIALYIPTNEFAGQMSVAGGSGANAGALGTYYFTTNLAEFQVQTATPTGTVNNVVASVDVTFNEVVDAASVSEAAFGVYTPLGRVAESDLTSTLVGVSTIRVSFPPQNLSGDYRLEVGQGIINLFGQPLAQPFTNYFTLELPTISGTVTNAAGLPVAGVMLQAEPEGAAATTDANGNYSIGVSLGWSGFVTPVLDTNAFVPGRLIYADVMAPVSGQNYLMVSTVAPAVVSAVNDTGLLLQWSGIPGVSYQAFWSTNLVDWQPWSVALPGTNGVMQLAVPLGTEPAVFFQIQAAN